MIASSFHVQLGDLPTWVLAALALGALVAAILAYRKQSASDRHLAEQVRLQGEALADQRKVNGLQARLLERTLSALSRQQAEAVVFAPEQGIAPDGTSGEVDGQLSHMAVVTNESRRPILDVTCRIRMHPAREYDLEAAKVAELGLPFSRQPQSTGRVAVILGGQSFVFRFAVPVANAPDARMKLRFTDDAGLRWQTDSDQHLEPFEEGDDW